MDPIDHAHMVAMLAKPGQAIIDTLTPEKAHAWHMASCICSESGELFDCVKKHVIYNKGNIDRTNLLEELGDLEFYLEGLRQVFHVTREECLEANIAKLGERYRGFKYSDQQAQDRADKQLPIGAGTSDEVLEQACRDLNA